MPSSEKLWVLHNFAPEYVQQVSLILDRQAVARNHRCKNARTEGSCTQFWAVRPCVGESRSTEWKLPRMLKCRQDSGHSGPTVIVTFRVRPNPRRASYCVREVECYDSPLTEFEQGRSCPLLLRENASSVKTRGV